MRSTKGININNTIGYYFLCRPDKENTVSESEIKNFSIDNKAAGIACSCEMPQLPEVLYVRYYNKIP